MELSYVIAALRRRLWLVAVLGAFGLVAAVGLTGGKAAQYEAIAELLVQPRTSANGVASSNDPDRFIAGEVASLKGAAVADQVAKRVPGTNRPMLAAAVTIEQTAKTDVVRIIARLPDPAQAQQVANAYAEIYIEQSEARDTAGYTAEIAEIERQLADLSAKINAIEVARAQLPPNSTNVAERTRDAELFTQASAYRSQYTTLLATQTNLRFSSTMKSRSEILQLAPLPDRPVASSTTIYAAAGAFLGLVMGAVAAVVWANASRRLLDLTQLEEILGAQVVGTMPSVKELAAEPKAAFERLPDRVAALIDQLCVRAEASAQGETDALTIAVVGSQRGAGATTVTLGMAGRFARNGARTVVIDADLADPDISRAFGALTDAGIPGLLSRLAAARRDPAPLGPPTAAPDESMPVRVFTPTSLPDVRVLGVGAPTTARSLHRTNVDTVIDAAARGGVDVVLIDGGPLLDAASTVRLCQVVDVVVLVVPAGSQMIEPLGVINRLLSYRSGDLLPVGTKLKPVGATRAEVHQPAHDPSDVDDIIEAATRWSSGGERARRPGAAGPAPTGATTTPGPGRSHVPVAASPRLGAPPQPRRRVALTPLDTDEAFGPGAGSRIHPARGLPSGDGDSDDADWVAPRPE